MADVDAAGGELTALTQNLEGKKWSEALLNMGNFLKDLGDAVQGCGVPQIGAVLEDTAKKLNAGGLATMIGDVVQILVAGADVTPDIQRIIVDAEGKQWASLGQDLGVLSDWISSTHCNSFVCRLVEGLLEEADMALTNLKPCEDELREAEGAFTDGAALWKKDQHRSAVKSWATGLNNIAQSVSACGLAQELGWIQQEANVLGLGNITAIGDVVQVIVHGADFYESLYAAVQDFEKHDYRSAGSELSKVMNQLSQWTTGHLCTSDVCYVVSGMLQYLADMQGDIQSCKKDFEEVGGNLSAGYHDLTENGADGFHFKHDAASIRRGVNDLGKAIEAFSHIVGDCHMQELAIIIEKLAEQLGIAPEVAWIEDVIKIMIDGVEIEQDVAAACEDYAVQDWPGVGYNVIKLAKILAENLAAKAPESVVV
jgi:hypothetical protein